MNALKFYIFVFLFTTSSAGLAAGTEALTAESAAQQQAQKNSKSITESSSAASKENKMGQIINIAVGGVNLATGAKCAGSCPKGPCCPLAPMFFLMGAQNLMQAKAQGSTGGQAGGAVFATDTGFGSGAYDPDAVGRLNSDPEMRLGSAFSEDVAKGKAGFTYDPKTNTVTTAKGTKIKGSDLNSSSAMEAAGVPKAAIDLLNSMEKDVVAKAMKKVNSLGLNTNIIGGEESSGGGGSAAGGSDAMAAGAGYGAGYGSMAGANAGLGVDRDPAQVAGMQKNFNGEPIGVAGDSIFKMMTRRYKVKESQSSFLDESDVLVQK